MSPHITQPSALLSLARASLSRPLLHPRHAQLFASLILGAQLTACEPAPPKALQGSPLAGDSAGEGAGAQQAGVTAGLVSGDTAGEQVAGEAGAQGATEPPVEVALCREGLMVGGPGLDGGYVSEVIEQGSPLAQRAIRGARGAQRLWRAGAQAPAERRAELDRLGASLKRDALVSLIVSLSALGLEARPDGLTLLSPLGQGVWLASLERPEVLSTLDQLMTPIWALDPLDLIDARLTRLASDEGDGALIEARATLWGSSVSHAKGALNRPQLSILKQAIKTQAGLTPPPALMIDEGGEALQTETYACLPYSGAEGRWTSPPVRLSWAEWRQLAGDPRVVWVSPSMPRPQLLNDPSRSITRAEEVQGLAQPVSGAGRYEGWSGRGVRVAVMDSGVSSHPDFFRYSSSGERRTERTLGDLPTEGEGHGTIVAGILAGNGWLSEQLRSPLGRRGAPLQWRGQAPDVSTIYSYLMQGEQGADNRPPWVQAFEEPEDGVAHLINHSHTYNNGYYAPENQGYDAFIASSPIPNKDQDSDKVEVIEGAGEGSAHPRPVFFAAGNNGFYEQADFLILKGYYGLMVNFKNAIIVGSIESNDTQHSDSSSLGPTLDGRVKPDVVAPGSSDPRPLSGFKISVGELRLHARPESGATDQVWRWSQPNGWVGQAGFDVTDPSTGAVIRGEVLEGFSYGNSYRTRLSWSASEEDRPLDPTLYDQLSFELKVEVPEQVSALDDLPDRPPLPLSSELPQFFAFNWADGNGSRFDGALYFAFGDELRSGEWSRVRVRLGDTDWAGANIKELHRLRITPGLYLSGVYAPSISGGYELSSGTSMASPAAAGVAALALEQLQSLGHFDLERRPPRPATVRALLSHTARDLKRPEAPVRVIPNPDTGEPSVYGRGPDWNTGYGLVDAWALARLIDAHGESTRLREDKISPGSLHRYRVHVSGSGPLKVSLAWDDPPASVLLEQWAPKLIHDLDIAVRGPVNVYGESDAVYGPWVLTPPPLHSERYTSGDDEFTASFVTPAERCQLSTLEELWSGQPRPGLSPTPLDVTPDGFIPQLNRGCTDELNNYEEVLIDAPSPGVYELIIRGPSTGGGTQRYSLVLSEGCQWGDADE